MSLIVLGIVLVPFCVVAALAQVCGVDSREHRLGGPDRVR